MTTYLSLKERDVQSSSPLTPARRLAERIIAGNITEHSERATE